MSEKVESSPEALGSMLERHGPIERAVVETGRMSIRELRAASEPDALIEALAATGLRAPQAGGMFAVIWLHQGLTRAGLPALCIETRAAKAAMGPVPNKTDRNDARGLNLLSVH